MTNAIKLLKNHENGKKISDLSDLKESDIKKIFAANRDKKGIVTRKFKMFSKCN